MVQAIKSQYVVIYSGSSVMIVGYSGCIHAINNSLDFPARVIESKNLAALIEQRRQSTQKVKQNGRKNAVYTGWVQHDIL